MKIDYNPQKGANSSLGRGLTGILGLALAASAVEPILEISPTTIQTRNGAKPGISLVWGDSAYSTNEVVSTNADNTVVTNQIVERIAPYMTDTNLIYTLQSSTNPLGRWNDVFTAPGNGYSMGTKRLSNQGFEFYKVVANPITYETNLTNSP